MNWLFKIFFSWKEKFQKVRIVFKGSSKDPFFYFGIISVVLFGILSFVSGHIVKSSSKQGDLFFLSKVSNILPETFNQNLFLDPAKKFPLESPDFLLVQKNSLIGISPPVMITPQVLGALTGEEFYPEINKEITEYIVEPGDNLLQISKKFNISLETILWANNLNKNSKIRPGQKIIILPISGVIHHVKAGDTISEISKKYQGKVSEIVAFNNLSDENDIFIGDILIIPNGVMPPPPVKDVPAEIPLASSFFISPILPPYKITQGLHWYNAVDLSNGKCGSPIYAVAQGEVLKIKYGWNGGMGNYLTILHPNGVVTTYAHLQAILVNPGDKVSQGQIIALMGGQPGTPGAGKSTGCHLHFSVSGARNPFAK